MNDRISKFCDVCSLPLAAEISQRPGEHYRDMHAHGWICLRGWDFCPACQAKVHGCALPPSMDPLAWIESAEPS